MHTVANIVRFLSITLLSGRYYAIGITIKSLEFRNGFDIVGLLKVCSCAPVFNIVSAPLGGAITIC